MKKEEKERIQRIVRERYGCAAKQQSTGCCCDAGDSQKAALKEFVSFGYSAEDVQEFFQNASVGLSCGNPLLFADMKPGETVLDLGSGLGFDCFLAARMVGEKGKVIGIDMTPEMISRSRENVARAGLDNIEVRSGKIEDLPVDDASVDIIISNCVVNLSPDKEKVFREAFRVLKPGGRLVISDLVATVPLPEEVRNDDEAYVKCLAGAMQIDELEAMLGRAGFQEISIKTNDASRETIKSWDIDSRVEDLIISAIIYAIK